ncbi:MAG: hypothetical protein RIS44_1582 [Pseudomonadota bacterium]|jgi:surface polysaccharide O-acyltransferase-like enzyme
MKFQQHMHIFRGVAICLIVVAHTLPSLDWAEHPYMERWLDALGNQSSILFFFIAGYLFQFLGNRFEYKAYLLQKAKTVILPYLILSVPALVVFTVLTQRQHMFAGFYDLPLWGQVGVFLITGKHLAPLWFVPTITLFYLAAPLLLWVDRKQPQLYWLIVPLMCLSAYLGRGGQLGPLNFAIYLLPVYLLGMAFSHHRERALECVRLALWPLLMVIAVGATGHALQWPMPPHWLLLMKTAMALVLTWLLWKLHPFIGNRLDEIADLSFGIFFIHAYFILILKIAAVYVLEGRVYDGVGEQGIPGNIWTFFVYAAVVMLCSVLILRLARKVLGSRSRMVVGA